MSNSNVLGIGIDLVENKHMEKVLTRWESKFKERIFLQKEQEYCDRKAVPCCYYAGRFAVKEAVSKAFGTGIGPHIGWLDIEIIKDPDSGAPSVKLVGKAIKLACNRGVHNIMVSLSHTRNYAIAQALLIGDVI